MTIDIEKLIEEIDEDGSGEIEFDEFKALLAAEGAAWTSVTILNLNLQFFQIIFLKTSRILLFESLI